MGAAIRIHSLIPCEPEVRSFSTEPVSNHIPQNTYIFLMYAGVARDHLFRVLSLSNESSSQGLPEQILSQPCAQADNPKPEEACQRPLHPDPNPDVPKFRILLGPTRIRCEVHKG